MNEILVDENGYKQFIDELDNLKKQSLLNASVGSEACEAAIGDGWHDNFAFEESMRQSRNIAAQIENMMKLKQLLRIVRCEKKNADVINIGDILKIKVYYSKNDVDEITIKLTGNYIPNVDEKTDIKEITLNSPLGNALYLKKVNSKNIDCVLNGNLVKIEIIEKLNVKE